jgi:hypothetical protein
MVSVCAWGIATAVIVIMIATGIGMTGGGVDIVGIAIPSGAMATGLQFVIAIDLGEEWSHSRPFFPASCRPPRQTLSVGIFDTAHALLAADTA